MWSVEVGAAAAADADDGDDEKEQFSPFQQAPYFQPPMWQAWRKKRRLLLTYGQTHVFGIFINLKRLLYQTCITVSEEDFQSWKQKVKMIAHSNASLYKNEHNSFHIQDVGRKKELSSQCNIIDI